MEAKRGPASGEKAGNANVLPVTASDESSSSTKKPARGLARPTKSEQNTGFLTEVQGFDKGLETKAKPAKVFGVELDAPAEISKPTHEREPSKTSEERDEQERVANVPEHLTADQELQVVEEYALDRLDTVNNELESAENNSADAFIARADKILLEHIAHAVRERSAETSTDDLLDDASEQAEASLGMSHEDDAHEMTEYERNEIINTILHGDSLDEGLGMAIPPAGSDETEGSAPIATPPAGGSGGAPTSPERFDADGGDDEPDRDLAARPDDSGGLPARPTSARPTSSESTTPRTSETAQRRHDFNNGLLIGGVLGYVIGRRHGRKKAERVFKPEEAHLKREVDDLQQKIVAREQHIRKLAAAKVIERQTETHATLDAHKNEFGRASLTSRETPATPNPALSAELVGAAAVVVGTTSAEVSAPAQKPERSVASTQEQTQPIASAAVEKPRLTAQDIKQMPQHELEDIAATIPVKGESLRRIYARGDIAKDDLRHIVIEYVQTGRIERSLQRAIAERQFNKQGRERYDDSRSETPNAVALATEHTLQTSSTESSRTAVKDAEYVQPTGQDQMPQDVQDKRSISGKIVVSLAVVIAVVIVAYAFLR